MPTKPRPPQTEPDLFFKRLVDNLCDPVYFVSRNCQITYWNRAAEELTGYSANEVVGSFCSQNLMHVDETGHCLCRRGCPLRKSMRIRQPQQAELYLLHKDGHRVPVSVRTQPVLDEKRRVVGAVELFTDNTRYRQTETHLQMLRSAARTDELTGLFNRRFLQEVLNRSLTELREGGVRFGVLLIDLDHFKRVNDHHGHACGDAVLAAIAKTLASSLRHGDILGRWGGDEFVAILPDVNALSLRRLAERCRALAERSEVRKRVRVTISVGGTVARKVDAVEQLLERADAKLYRSKHAGRNRITMG